jgi:hypothetical protein
VCKTPGHRFIGALAPEVVVAEGDAQSPSDGAVRLVVERFEIGMQPAADHYMRQVQVTVGCLADAHS